MDEGSKKKPDKKKDQKLFFVYRPNTGQQVKQVRLENAFLKQLFFSYLEGTTPFFLWNV